MASERVTLSKIETGYIATRQATDWSEGKFFAFPDWDSTLAYLKDNAPTDVEEPQEVKD